MEMVKVGEAPSQLRQVAWMEEVVHALQGQGIEADSRTMEAYMKNQFPFLGLKKPLRSALLKPLFSTENLPEKHHLESICRALWTLPEREYQMVALDLIRKFERRLTPKDLSWMEHLIREKSWWDSVDFLATHPVGFLVERYPEELGPWLDSWITSDDIWLNRTAIICQVLYRQKTDKDLLRRAICAHIRSTEFFHRKAIGWALRAYAQQDPEWVRNFVEEHRSALSGLSVREALKHLE